MAVQNAKFKKMIYVIINDVINTKNYTHSRIKDAYLG